MASLKPDMSIGYLGDVTLHLGKKKKKKKRKKKKAPRKGTRVSPSSSVFFPFLYISYPQIARRTA
jgi:hypothetical protein